MPQVEDLSEQRFIFFEDQSVKERFGEGRR
jgi:hypothetical protein